MLTFILGGARSGKSRFAQQLCSRQPNVTYVATALVNDDEMRARVDRHRADRPAEWRTIEEPLCLARAVERVVSDSRFVLLDCLTLWLSNFCWNHKDKAESEIQRLASSEIDSSPRRWPTQKPDSRVERSWVQHRPGKPRRPLVPGYPGIYQPTGSGGGRRSLSHRGRNSSAHQTAVARGGRPCTLSWHSCYSRPRFPHGARTVRSSAE